MRITLPFDEALTLATSGAALPSMLDDVHCEGSTIHADIDLPSIETTSFAMKMAFAAAGTVAVTARFVDFVEGIAQFAVTAHARAMPAHKLVPYLIDPINDALARSGAPEGVVTLRRGEHEPVVALDLQRAVDSRMPGMGITMFDLAGAILVLEATVGASGVESATPD